MTDQPKNPPLENDEVRILPPDFSIKKKIGMDVDINQIFTPERIEAAQKSIDAAQQEFVQWANKDLVELEHSYHKIQVATSKEETARCIDKICKIAFALKCQGGTFGYSLGSWVANSLYRFLQDYHQQDIKDQLTVIRKHIDALQVIFTHNVLGEGDKIGRELMDGLEKLIAKFAK